MVKISDKTWSTGEGNGKPLLRSYLENPMNTMKRQKSMTLKHAPPRSVGVRYAIGEEKKIAPGRMKRLSQIRHNAQMWKCPVVRVKFNAVKNNIA